MKHWIARAAGLAGHPKCAACVELTYALHGVTHSATLVELGIFAALALVSLAHLGINGGH